MGKKCPACGEEHTDQGIGAHYRNAHGGSYYDGLIRSRFEKPPEVWLREKYHVQGRSLEEIAQIIDCANASTVRSIMERHGVPRRKSTREMPPWFGTVPQGHEAVKTNMGKSGMAHVYIHRLVAVAKEGFDAVVDMDVHHKNNIPWDNRPENLEVKDHAQHSSDHAKEQWEQADGKSL